MEWPSPAVPGEVDEKPWASLGSPPEVAGMSLGASDHPWHADDVGPQPFYPSPIPARQRNHLSVRTQPLALDDDDDGNSVKNIAASSDQAHTPTHVRLLWPAGPSPIVRPPSPPTPWRSRTASRSACPDSPAFLTTRASTRTARLELLVATRRVMDYLNDAGEYARTSYNSAAQTAGSVGRALTSKTAQRTLLTTVLFSLVSVVLFAVACVGYLAFYHNYLPDQVISLPVHLQYG